MHVALIAPPWLPVPPPAYGGTEVVIDGLARGLSQAGHRVTLFATGDSTCPVETRSCYAHGVGFTVSSGAYEIRHVAEAWAQIRGYDGSDRIDVVHDHTVLGPLVATRSGAPPVPTLTTNHAPFTPEIRFVYRTAGPQVGLIAISRHQASTAQEIPVCAVIHHGIDVEHVPTGPGGTHAVFLGRFTPDKGVERAIHLARAAGVPLAIAGKRREQTEIDYFDARIRPLLGPDVEYVGEVGGDAKWAFLGGARCLLNPIAWPEPFGLVMVEALACGTPVVAPPVATVPEIVVNAETGWIAPDDAGLAADIERAGEIDRARCRTSAEEHFSLARMADDHVGLYRQLTGG